VFIVVVMTRWMAVVMRKPGEKTINMQIYAYVHTIESLEFKITSKPGKQL